MGMWKILGYEDVSEMKRRGEERVWDEEVMGRESERGREWNREKNDMEYYGSSKSYVAVFRRG